MEREQKFETIPSLFVQGRQYQGKEAIVRAYFSGWLKHFFGEYLESLFYIFSSLGACVMNDPTLFSGTTNRCLIEFPLRLQISFIDHKNKRNFPNCFFRFFMKRESL